MYGHIIHWMTGFFWLVKLWFFQVGETFDQQSLWDSVRSVLGGFVCLFSHVWRTRLLGTWSKSTAQYIKFCEMRGTIRLSLGFYGAIVHSCFAVAQESYQTFQLFTLVSCTSWPQNTFPPPKKISWNVSRNIYFQFHCYLYVISII